MMMNDRDYQSLFTEAALEKIFPQEKADQFFEALYGDSDEGAYDIGLAFAGHTGNQLNFEFHLRQRPGKCLACNLTYGLPNVLSRHPVIDVKGLVNEINSLLDGRASCRNWKIGRTREVSRILHVVPFVIELETR
ncbi:MAG: pancreas/duodenum homeobox protein 1 [Thermodesulfobacteriota bacterium]